MKRIMLSMAFLLCASYSYATVDVDKILDKVPVNQGVVYSFVDSEFAHVSTAEVIKKWGTSAEVGYSDNGKLVGVLSYKLIDAKDYIDIPILQELEFKPGLYVGVDELDKEAQWDYGISLTMLQLTW